MAAAARTGPSVRSDGGRCAGARAAKLRGHYLPSSALFSMGTSSLLGYYPVAKPSLPAFCSLLCKRRFVSDDSAARNGRTASVSASECRVVQPAGGESVGVAPHWRCTVRNGAGLRPALKVKVWAAQPAPRASVRCPLPPSVVWDRSKRSPGAAAQVTLAAEAQPVKLRKVGGYHLGANDEHAAVLPMSQTAPVLALSRLLSDNSRLIVSDVVEVPVDLRSLFSKSVSPAMYKAELRRHVEHVRWYLELATEARGLSQSRTTSSARSGHASSTTTCSNSGNLHQRSG